MNQDRINRKLHESKERQEPKAIKFFQGEQRWLSNFWPCEVWLEGLRFTSVEHAYQAAKTTDINIRRQIQDMESPGQVKRFSRTLQLRQDWDRIKEEVMSDLVRQKFTRSYSLGRKLVDTRGKILEEGNRWHDRFWGICHCQKCNGNGQNRLGKILMKVRDKLI